MSTKLHLKLYVNGMTSTANQALANLDSICKSLKEDYAIEVVDIRKHPELAEDAKIIVTPTLIKNLPPPIRRIVGDLSEREHVLLGLDIVESADDAPD